MKLKTQTKMTDISIVLAVDSAESRPDEDPNIPWGSYFAKPANSTE